MGLPRLLPRWFPDAWGVETNVLEDGELKLSYSTNAYKEALKWFNKLYNDGILTKETVIAAQSRSALRDL